MSNCHTCLEKLSFKTEYCEFCGEITSFGLKNYGTINRRLPLLKVGSSSSCEIQIHGESISPLHLAIDLQDDNSVIVQDTWSENGTFLENSNHPLKKEYLNLNDKVLLGSKPLVLRNLVQKYYQNCSESGEEIYIRSPMLTIGRASNCQICIPDPAVELLHAAITLVKGMFHIEPLSETGITRLNGVRVRKPELLNDGDGLLIGSWLFVFQGNALIRGAAWKYPYLLVKGLTKSIKNRQSKNEYMTLLDNISLSFFPGELVAILGPSGAGKTTFLKTLCGYHKPTNGEVQLNGLNFHKHYSWFRHVVGFVPQEDLFYKELTVAQTLRYAYKIRTGQPLTEEEIESRIDQVLNQLALFESNPNIKSTKTAFISGGQRRRVNLAIELITDPAIMFLDEPLSGLSSEDAKQIVQLLRNLADEGRTIILTMHQPNQEIYLTLDQVVYLHVGGKLAFYGPPYPNSLQFTNPEMDPDVALKTPEVCLTALDKKKPHEWQSAYNLSGDHHEMVVKREYKHPAAPLLNQSFAKDSLFRQLKSLLPRNVLTKLQDPQNLILLLAQAPIIAGLIGITFQSEEADAYKNIPITTFLMAIASIWFGCSNAVRDVCGEWQLYLRERMANLRIPAYLISKFIILAAIDLVQSSILVITVKTMCHLRTPFLSLLFSIWIICLCGSAIGLLISAVAAPLKKSNEIAVGMLPIIILPMVIMGGMVKPIKDMKGITELSSNFMVSRWAFSALLELEASNQSTKKSIQLNPESSYYISPQKYIRSAIFKENEDYMHGMMLIVCIGFICLVMSGYLLKSRDLL